MIGPPLPPIVVPRLDERRISGTRGDVFFVVGNAATWIAGCGVGLTIAVAVVRAIVRLFWSAFAR